MSTKKCIQCGDKLVGRTDKKFCDYLCRSAFYNELHGKTNNYIRRVNRILKQNRRILKALDHKEVSKSKLADLGFSFGYFTNTHLQEDKTCFFCYEFGYVPLENNYFAVISTQE